MTYLKRTIGSLLDGSLNCFIASRLLSPCDEINHRDIGGRDTEGHATEAIMRMTLL